jgi:alpha-galactosidase
MGIGADGSLRHLYWGAPLWRMDDLSSPPERHDISSFDPHQMIENEEFPGWGGPRYYEPALKITREDGNRDLVLRYVSHRIQQNDLDIVLRDIRDAIEVTLHYRVYPEQGILRRHATIRNATARPLTVAAWDTPATISTRGSPSTPATPPRRTGACGSAPWGGAATGASP